MGSRLGRTWLPPNVLVMFGASAAGYALLLAGVAGLQSKSEAALAAARQPAVSGIEVIAAGHDALRERLDAARASYAGAADALLGVTGGLDRLDEDLSSFSGVVTAIDGVARNLPTRVAVPQVPRAVRQVRVPTTHATTGASGG